MRISDFTGIARALDPRYLTNRAILVLMLAAATGWSVATGDLWQGGRAALDVFFAWALCRELDPDHDYSAFLAAALVLVGLALGATSSAPLFWLLLVIRVVNRTTGLGATHVDSLLVLYLGVTSACGLLTALAFALDAVLRHGRRRQWLYATAALLGSPWHLDWSQPSPPDLVVTLSLGVLFLLVVHSSRQLASVDDTTTQPLDPTRVRCGQLLALTVGLLGSAFAGFAWQQVLPLWTAVAAASLWRIGLHLVPASERCNPVTGQL